MKKNVLIIKVSLLFYSICTFEYCDAKACDHRYFGHDSTVCVCNKSHCDTISPVIPLAPGRFLAYTSSRDGLRFSKLNGNFSDHAAKDPDVIINVNEKEQEIFGWGGAFTDSGGINMNLLNKNTKKKLLRAYFSKHGIEYSLCRVPIASTDFSLKDYSYDDVKGDVNLTYFNITSDDYKYKISLIKRALKLTNNTLKFYASAWNPPMWMKTNGKPMGFGFLKREYYQTWADYHIKFLDAYKNVGIKFWGLTTGNEPSVPFIPNVRIPALGWTPWEEDKWIAENLGPTIRNSEYADIKIITYDDVRPLALIWLILGAINKSRRYVDGIGVHGYLRFLPSQLGLTHLLYPDKFILSTETSTGGASYIEKIVLGSWERAEIYADDIIYDMNRKVTGWVEWNLVLNTEGGPNYVQNYADASIIVNVTSQEFYKQPTYYAIGHFSKFIPPSSCKISTVSNAKMVEIIGFQRPDNGTVIIAYNKQSETIPVTFYDPRRGYISFDVVKKSINTILYW